ncbi:MAG: toxin-antitoxin system YwqK family antitoxin [Kiritimatiellia bacterium]
MKRIYIALSVLLICQGPAGPVRGENDETVTKVIEKLEDAPARGRRPLKDAFEQLPEGCKIRITVDRFFDQGHSTSSGLFEPYVSSFVPVNAEGKEDGVQRFLETNQRVSKTVTWKEGVKDGPECVYNVWPRYKKAEVPWVKGKIEGTRKTFYENGNVRSETPYKDGEPHGLAKNYSTNGRVTRECTMKQGVRDGKLVDYWPRTAQPRRVITYDMGKVQGIVREFYENSQLKREVPFENDTMHGEEKRFEENGEPARSRYWINGDLVSKTEFELKSE